GGSALAVDWAQQRLPAILMAWYPGQRGGDAVADILFGDTNPSGRLPLTFYKQSEQLPPFDDYAMDGRTYRYFTGQPLYAFGHGLSYTRFAYSNLRLDRARVAADGSLQASITVKNVGPRAGDEVVQLYVAPLESNRPRANKDLRAVKRVTLQPGATANLSFTLKPSTDLRYYDVDAKRYAVGDGRYEVQIGASSADIRARQAFQVER
ncbi:MAG: glycoside hydrolase family 3 C-terminal domain-containing protein, partial [Pseudomonadota bacterium]|nr:glycoside hydrolase family 3 C-terminal domain-containing protein [Pseudomonadota bacterium]